MAQENVAATTEYQNGTTKAVTFTSLKPQLVVPAPKAADAVQFYKAAFGAEELKRSMHPKRKADQELPLILCAELKLGSTVLLVCDQADDKATAVASTDGSGFFFCLETEDIDGAVDKAVKAGAVRDGDAAEDEGGCSGGRFEKLKDPFGYVWAICAVGKCEVEA